MAIIVGFDIEKRHTVSGSLAKMNQLIWVLDVMEGWVSEQVKECLKESK